MQPALRNLIPVLCLTVCLVLSNRTSAAEPEPFDYFRNSWNTIGLKDYKDGTRVTPENELMLGGERRLRLSCGPALTPLGRQPVKTLLDGWLPVIRLQTSADGVDYHFLLWATPLPDTPDWERAFDWPIAGENYLNWVQVTAVNRSATQAVASLKAELHGKTNALLGEWRQPLSPSASAGTVFRVPFHPLPDARSYGDAPADLWLERTTNFWRKLMGKGTQITVPCPKSQQTLLAAHVCQLIANDHGVLHAGEGFYDEFYIRDGGYQLMQYLEAGFWDEAKKAVEAYLPAQRTDGRFETQSDQYDANGQAVWVLWYYYQMTRDEAWLRKAYPAMRKAVDWASRSRKLAPADSPFRGLLPAAPADGEYLWDGKHHIVGYDFWNLRAMLCTIEAARVLGKTDEAEDLTREAQRYRAAIDAAWLRTGLPHFPPSWEKDGTHWGNTETLWPTPLFDRKDPRVTASLTELRERHGGGFLEGTLRWTGLPHVIHPYLSSYTSLASMIRGDHETFVDEFYWYLLHSSASHAFPEGIYHRRRYAWSETIPHALGAANYTILLRHALAHEEGDDLHLLSGVPDWWLDNARQIRMQRAPTRFGELQFSVTGKWNGVQVTCSPPTRNPPGRIVLHLPENRPLLNALQGVTVVTRTPDTKRWDFPAIIKAYKDLPAPAVKPIAGLVQLPLAIPLRPDQCQTLDLAGSANTDPFTAPFGVERPGRYLFTGLKPGPNQAGGIPFQVLDPSRNHGKALVVLQGASACAKFPREIRIPVQTQGKRLFFLGNVHGWSPEDEGKGEFGALAEYEVVYSDGQKQTIPLIASRTTDDWASTPATTEATVGLSASPWHLNVLGVTLRPARIDHIIFRDLGTSASPLLAAITLENW